MGEVVDLLTLSVIQVGMYFSHFFKKENLLQVAICLISRGLLGHFLTELTFIGYAASARHLNAFVSNYWY